MTCPGGVSCVSLEAFAIFIIPILTVGGIITLVNWLRPEKEKYV